MKKWVISICVAFFSVFGFFSSSDAAEDVKETREEQLMIRHMEYVSNLSHYIVREGDTFSSIAQFLFMNQDELRRLNHRVKPDVLSVGQHLNLDEKNIPKVENSVQVSSPRTKKQAIASRGIDKKPVAKAVKHVSQTVKTKPIKEAAKTAATATTFVASAYTASADENGGWAGLDYFGNPLKVGTVAVDPKVIPLGTKLYIAGYNTPYLPQGGMVAYATDIGGSIKGNRIDIYLPTSQQNAWNFGYQNIKVQILK